jgi:hypothetical protein
MSKGPQQILQLVLQEHVDGFMEEEIIDINDYVDWFKWVSNVERKKRPCFYKL